MVILFVESVCGSCRSGFFEFLFRGSFMDGFNSLYGELRGFLFFFCCEGVWVSCENFVESLRNFI